MKLKIGDRVSFETSKGIVRGIYKPETVSVGEGVLHRVEITDGRKHLDSLYQWDSVKIEGSWVKVELDDASYGCPEYKFEVA